MKQKTKLPSLISLLILTLVTTLTWIGFDIYRAFNKPAVSAVPETISKDISPSLDAKTIDNIKSRLFLSGSEIPQVQIAATASPSAAPTEIPTASPTASPSAELTATASATPTP